jgi:ubiquinone/menaquinone biosynthesis C-methylase UbiE
MGSGIPKRQSSSADTQGALQQQFNLPRGLLGRVVGWWMGRENARLNRIAIELLEIAHGDRVLEIGFGAGDAIAHLVERTAAQFIAGIDPSQTMVEQARERNLHAIATKRVCLLQAAVEAMPFPDANFSKAYAVSNFHTWQDCRRGLKELYRVLTTKGTLLICLRKAPPRPRWFTKPGISPEELAADSKLLEEVGFRDLRTIERKVGQGVVCLVARR